MSNLLCDDMYFQTLIRIHSLFRSKKFKNKISSKSDPNTINQTLIYYNPIDITDAYTLKIHNKSNIELTIPLKKTNFTFTTQFSNPKTVLNYLDLHLEV